MDQAEGQADQAQQIKRSLGTRDLSEARRKLRDFRNEAERLDPSAGRVTFDSVIKKYLTTIQHQALSTVTGKKGICGQAVSLGSFSAMQHVVDPELLAGLLRSLAGEALPRFGDGKDREKIGELIAVDGTLLSALPRMAWAIWQNPQNRAGKLHLEFNVWRQIPVEFTVTDGNGNERAVWKSTADTPERAGARKLLEPVLREHRLEKILADGGFSGPEFAL